MFSLDFVATEFPIENYRFDTVAFNKDSMSFLIIEYKRGRNESLVDQGYAYLYTLLNRKADFVLLYNERFSKSCNIKDFDWSQSRIVFVSPQFTDYKKNATSFSKMPFELYEIKIANQEIMIKQNYELLQLQGKESDHKYNKIFNYIIIFLIIFVAIIWIIYGFDTLF